MPTPDSNPDTTAPSDTVQRSSTVRTVRLPSSADHEVTLAHQACGSGPPLFLVGAPVGRSGFADLATQLADRFTVITHDPRGVDASAAAGDARPPTPEVLAEDLRGLADHLGTGPALFFGASGGAVTLLALLARHGELIRRAVLHEAPLVTLLDEPETTARPERVFALAADDPQRATQDFFDLTGAGHSTGPTDTLPAHTPLPPMPAADLDRNRYFLGRMAGPTMLHVPDLPAMAGQDLLIGAGRRSHHQLARRASAVLAERLGVALHDLPGNHLAPSTEPVEFADALTTLLDS